MGQVKFKIDFITQNCSEDEIQDIKDRVGSFLEYFGVKEAIKRLPEGSKEYNETMRSMGLEPEPVPAATARTAHPHMSGSNSSDVIINTSVFKIGD